MQEIIAVILLGIASAIFMAIGTGYILAGSTPQPQTMKRNNNNSHRTEGKNALEEYRRIMAEIDRRQKKGLPEMPTLWRMNTKRLCRNDSSG